VFDRSDRIAIVDDTADSELGNLGMSREQCIHSLRRTLPTRCEVRHWFMTLEVLATDRKDDEHGDHDRQASMTAALHQQSYHDSRHGLAIPAHDQPMAVMLDLVNPAWTERRLGGQCRDAGIDKPARCRNDTGEKGAAMSSIKPVTPDEAAAVWRSIQNPSARRVAKALTQAGRRVHFATIARWRSQGWRPVANGPRPIQTAREALEVAARLLTGDPAIGAEVFTPPASRCVP
jgi:hypothetical protein